MEKHCIAKFEESENGSTGHIVCYEGQKIIQRTPQRCRYCEGLTRAVDMLVECKGWTNERDTSRS